MIIDRLILNNFKSYSGEQVIGPFDSHFSCIIGPNGNGKSNVIDALLFVFGFKSAKLRQDKLSSLIHYSAYSKPEYCRVDVIFIDGMERIKVGRSVNQKGTSYYYLNEAKKSYSEVKAFLMDKNLDLEKKLFIILQGEVQKLCQLDCLSLIEYLQYIAGSDQYKSLIEGKQSSYIENGVKKQELQNLVCLKKKQFEKNENQCISMTALLMAKIRVAQIQFLISKRVIQDLQVKILTYREKQHENVNKLQLLQQQQKNRKQKIVKICQQRSTLQVKKLTFSRQIALQEEKMKQVGREISQFQRNKSYKIKDKEMHKQQIQKMQAKIVQLINLKNKSKDVQDQYAEIKQSVFGLNPQLISQFQKLIEFQSHEQSLLSTLIQSQSHLKYLKENKTKIRQEIEKIQKTKLQYNATLLKHQIKIFNDELFQLSKKIERQQQQLDLLKEKKNSVSGQAIKLTKQDSIANYLISAGNSNKLQGIVGVLKNFVIIEQQYESLVMTTVPQLNFILVDNFSNAMKGIKYLNENKLGKTTFIVIDYIKSLNLNYKASFKAPDHTRRIYDVCKVLKPQLEQIFYWCVGNALIADNLDAAMKVAYGRVNFRVVTINYQYIDLSGAMTRLMPKQGKKQSIESLIKIQEQTIHKLELLKEQKQNKQKQKQQKMDRIQVMENANIKMTLIQLNENLKNIIDQQQEQKQKVGTLRNKFEKNKFQALNAKKVIEEKFGYRIQSQSYLKVRQTIQKYSLMKQQMRQLNSSEDVTIIMEQKISAKLKQYQKIIQDIQLIQEQIKAENEKMIKIQSILTNYRNEIRSLDQQLQLLEQQEFIIGTTAGSTHQQAVNDTLKKIRQQLRKDIEIKNNHIKHYQNSQSQISQLTDLANRQIHLKIMEKIEKKPIFLLGSRQLFFQDFDADLLSSVDQNKLKNAYAVAKQHMELLASSTQLDVDIYIEYTRLKQDYENRKSQLDQLQQMQKALRNQLILLRTKRTDIFMKFFTSINIYMNNIYFELTGGNAQIMLIDSLNPFQGAQFMVRPANKSWKTVNLLSGGQKTMTSLSLIFVCEKIRKFPFYIMDEIDAALDYRNTSSLAKYISQKCDVQHIVVSLRKNMYQQSKSLIGIYKVKEMTNSIRVPMKELRQEYH